MEKTTSKMIIPVMVYTSCIKDYSKVWHEDYMNSASDNLARSIHGKVLPHCSSLNVYGGAVSGYFCVDECVKWALKIYVFRNDEDMDKFMELNGGRDVYGSVQREKDSD